MSERDEIAPAWRAALLEHRLERPSALLRSDADVGRYGGAWEALTKPGLGGRRRWRWTLTPNVDQTETPVLYVKRYADTPLREQWDRFWRQSMRHGRAYWEYRQARRLAEAHINVPDAVAYAEKMSGPFEQRGVVILDNAPGDGFDRVWRRLVDEGAPITHGPARHEITARLARFVAAFHGTGCCHRDLYLCHIFADLDSLGRRPPRFTLIDLARTHYPRWRRMRWIIKDLSQLDASACELGATRADRWRFLRAYLNLPAHAPRVRFYARRIVRKSIWILRREERKKRRS